MRLRLSNALALVLLLVADLAAPAMAAAQPPAGDYYLGWTRWQATGPLPPYYLEPGLFPFDHPAGALRLPLDPRTLQLQVDPESARVTTALSAAEVPLGPGRTESFEQYAQRLTETNLRRKWVAESRQRINREPPEDARSTGAGLKVALPVELPGAVQSILGTGAPSINVSGSERISIAGRSNWSNQENVFGRGQSLFPQLDMRQDLDINLSGTLGDKVSVDVAQSSGAQTSLANRVAIRYNGYEDEIIRRLHLGNTQLSMPGTQYVSYSGRNDGLFGVMTEARIGGANLALVASKQEARSERTQFVGTRQDRSYTVEDWQYIERTYFLLQRPDEVVDAQGNLRPDAPRVDIGSVQVFIDDNIDQDLGGEQPGLAERADPRPGSPVDSVRLVGKFDKKEPIKDFEISIEYFGREFPVLVLRSAVPDNATLAVLYNDTRGPLGGTVGDTLRLKLLKAPRQNHKVANGRFIEDPAVDPLAPVRDYELRNFYSLGSSNISPEGTQILIQRLSGGGTQEFVEQFRDPDTGENIAYLEATGIDLLNQTQGGTPVRGPDGFVDQFTNASFVDWERGILYFPDLRPFAPQLEKPGELHFSRSRAPITPRPTRRRFLSNDPQAPIEIRGNPAPYTFFNQQDRREARTFVIFARYASASGSNTVLLRNTPIVENSEIVAVNGEPLVRDRDYRIDYQAGVVDLLSEKARDPNAQLTIDYSYAPLFSQASKTLVGSSLRLVDTPELGLGGAFIYESRGQQERRPRLGEEPSRTLIGDLNGRVQLKPEAMTSLVNLLPFYEGREESRLQISAEMGHSMPNPNTKNEVYVDDFEGTRNASTAALDARAWVPPAPPPVLQGAAQVPVGDVHDPAPLVWFNPFNVVRQGDLRPNLTRAEDSEAPLNVLALWVARKWQGGTKGTMWAGLTQSLDADGLDLSRSQFLDLWLNDFRDFARVRRPGVKLHIDLGVVSEDQQRYPDSPPNGVLDTEDRLPRDRQLDASEDTGLDSLFSNADPRETVVRDSTARINASFIDPSGDDWRTPDTQTFVNERDPRRWRFTNGTERNQQYRGVPDTEDLDGNGRLDVSQNFFRFTIDFGDTTFLDTDVFAKFANDPNVTRPVAADNGWRRFIIPLADPSRESFGSPDLHTVKHIRVWIEGLDQLQPYSLDPKVSIRPTLEIGQIDIVGNRWVANPIDSVAALFGQDLVVRTVNNREDEAVYEPPFRVESQTQGGSSAQEREQSLALRARDLVPGGRVSAFRTTTLPEDYSRYRAMRFWAAALDFSPLDSLRFFVRFVSDAGNEERNYYEYSAPLPPVIPLGVKPIPWVDYDLDLTAFSDLKIDLPGDSTRATIERPAPRGGVARFSVSGRPSFTRVQRVVIGLENARPAPADSSARDSAYAAGRTQPGELWVNELRSVDIARDRGTAGRLSVISNFSDLLSLTVSVDKQDENFLRLGQARGSGNDFLSTQVSGSTRLHRFLGDSGWQIPVNFSISNSSSTPRFRTGQDILLRGDDAEREKSETWSRNLSASISHSGSKHWLLKNTLDGLSFGYQWSDAQRRTPVSADTSRSLSGRGSYTLAPGNWLKVPLPLLKAPGGRSHHLLLLPQSVSLAFAMSTRRNILYDRANDGTDRLASRLGQIYSKDVLWTLSAGWRPIPIAGYSFTSTRNANLSGIEPARIAGINFGRQTGFNQRLDARLPIRFGPWLSPEVDGNTMFTESRGPELSPNLTLGNFGNSSNVNLRYTLPLRLLAGKPKPAGADTSGGGGFGLPIGKLLSRFGDIQTRGSFSRNTSYSRLTGVPSIGYRLGFDRDPGFLGPERPIASVYRTDQSSENSQRTYSGEANTQLALWGRASARLRANYSHVLRTSNTQAFVQETRNWPDVNLDWGTVQKLLRLGAIFPTITASTRYARTVSEDGVFGQAINSRTSSNNWSPLISFSGTTRSGVQTLLSAERTSSLREDFRNSGVGPGPRVSTDTRQTSTTVRANMSKTFAPGSKFSFLGLFGSTLRTTVTLSLTGSYNKRTGGTQVPGQTRLGGEINNDRIEMQASGTYSFSRNVNGTLGLGYSQFRNLTQTVIDSQGRSKGHFTQRSVRLEASAVMSF